MSTNLFQAADTPEDVHKGARQRMLAARDRVRRYFSPEAIAGTDEDVAEVVGRRDVIADVRTTDGR